MRAQLPGPVPITGELKKPHHIDTDKCIKCGTCKTGCPFGAIKEA